MDDERSLPPPPTDESEPVVAGLPPEPPMAEPMPPAKPRRPTGVTIMAILMILFGLVWTLGTAMGVSVGAPGLLSEINVAWGISFWMVFIFSVLMIVLGAGLFTVNRWAWIGTVVVILLHLVAILMFILIPTFIVSAAAPNLGLLAGAMLTAVCFIPLVLDIIILIYMLLPGTRLSFV